jgi:hypothetical protein
LPLGRCRGAVDLDQIINKDLDEFVEPDDLLNDTECQELLLGSKRKRKNKQKTQEATKKLKHENRNSNRSGNDSMKKQPTTRPSNVNSVSDLVILDEDENSTGELFSSEESNLSSLRASNGANNENERTPMPREGATALDLTTDPKIIESLHVLRELREKGEALRRTVSKLESGAAPSKQSFNNGEDRHPQESTNFDYDSDTETVAPSLILNVNCTFNPQPFKVRIFYHDRFQKLKQIFARSLDVPESQIILKYDGITLNPLHTPSHFHMKNDDLIVASLSTGSPPNCSNSHKKTTPEIPVKASASINTDSSANYSLFPKVQSAEEEKAIVRPEVESSIKNVNFPVIDDKRGVATSQHTPELNDTPSVSQPNNEKASPQQIPSIVLKVLLDSEQKPLQFRLRLRDPFYKLINAICERRSVTPDQLRLTFDGVVILPHQCPQELEMQDEDLLDATILK